MTCETKRRGWPGWRLAGLAAGRAVAWMARVPERRGRPGWRLAGPLPGWRVCRSAAAGRAFRPARDRCGDRCRRSPRQGASAGQAAARIPSSRAIWCKSAPDRACRLLRSAMWCKSAPHSDDFGGRLRIRCTFAPDGALWTFSEKIGCIFAPRTAHPRIFFPNRRLTDCHPRAKVLLISLYPLSGLELSKFVDHANGDFLLRTRTESLLGVYIGRCTDG